MCGITIEFILTEIDHKVQWLVKLSQHIQLTQGLSKLIYTNTPGEHEKYPR